MGAVRVSSLRIGVTLGAGDLLRSLVVGEGFNVGVAVDARKQRAVNGMLELRFVNVEADGLAIRVGGEGLVGVAGKAVGVLQFLRRMES